MMEARLPLDKLNRTFSLVTAWLKKRRPDILSLVGSLQHASKVVHCSRPFLSRMYATAARVRELDYYTRLNKEFHSDLHWWHTFLTSWNGLSLFRSTIMAPKFHILTNAFGSWGCRALFQGHWFQLPWDNSWLDINVMAKELLPIILSTAVWGQNYKNHKCATIAIILVLLMHCPRALREILLSCNCSVAFGFLLHITVYILYANISQALRIYVAADHLSRNNITFFFSSYPQASPKPTPLPPSLLPSQGQIRH